METSPTFVPNNKRLVKMCGEKMVKNGKGAFNNTFLQGYFHLELAFKLKT